MTAAQEHDASVMALVSALYLTKRAERATARRAGVEAAVLVEGAKAAAELGQHHAAQLVTMLAEARPC